MSESGTPATPPTPRSGAGRVSPQTARTSPSGDGHGGHVKGALISGGFAILAAMIGSAATIYATHDGTQGAGKSSTAGVPTKPNSSALAASAAGRVSFGSTVLGGDVFLDLVDGDYSAGSKVTLRGEDPASESKTWAFFPTSSSIPTHRYYIANMLSLRNGLENANILSLNSDGESITIEPYRRNDPRQIWLYDPTKRTLRNDFNKNCLEHHGDFIQHREILQMNTCDVSGATWALPGVL